MIIFLLMFVPAILSASDFSNFLIKAFSIDVYPREFTCLPILDGIIGWWPGDGDANDIVGGNNGTLENGTVFSPSVVAQGFHTDGLDDYILVQSNASLNPHHVTVNVWVKFDSFYTGQCLSNNIVSKGGDNAAGFYGLIVQDVSGCGQSSGVKKAKFYVRFSDSSVGEVWGATPIDTDTFYNIAGAWDGTSLKVYVNGVLDGQVFYPNKVLGNNTSPLLIGKHDVIEYPYNFRGSIDEVLIFNRPLTDGEMQAIYTVGSYGICKSNNSSVPFLDLPVSYSNFAQAAQGNIGGNRLNRVNSWFDHTSPNYSENSNITRWDGRVFTFTVSSPSRIGESWYDGHNGIDLKHNTDMPKEVIYAAAPGIVTQTITTCVEGDKLCGNYYGNQVWIDHGNGYATQYAHLQAVSVTVGTYVTNIISQPLGIMGNTGNSTGTHLHFGFYYDQNGDGQWAQTEVVDPYGWLGQDSDPWTIPSQYMWKYSLQAQQAADSSGGNVTSPSGNVSVTVPVGTLTSTITLDLWETPPVAAPSVQLRSSGQSFLLRVLEWLTGGSSHNLRALSSSSFSLPATITITYSDTAISHLNESQLTIYRWDDSNNNWTPLPTIVDSNQHQVMAQTTEMGNFDLQAPLVCPADTSEPNDDYYTAANTPANGIGVNNLFDGIQDEDWFRFDTTTDEKYIVQTSNLTTDVDTEIQIYDMDGITPLVSNDNGGGGLASRVQWRAPRSATYFVRVSRTNGGIYGCGATYHFSIEQNQQIFLPLIQR